MKRSTNIVQLQRSLVDMCDLIVDDVGCIDIYVNGDGKAADYAGDFFL